MTGSGAPAEGEQPLERHRIKTQQTIASGDGAAIKRLYVELGRDFWDTVARQDGYEVPVLSAPETLSTVSKALESATGLILDAGCGPNPAVALALATAPSRTVVALDIGWGTVRTAQSVAEGRGLHLLPVAGDVERLPFRSAAFEGLVCDDTIEHLPDDRLGVQELARVLKPGGQAVLATPNRHSAAVLRLRLRHRAHGIRRPSRDYFVASSHLREYTWSEFESLVGAHFVIDGRRPVGWRDGIKRRLITGALWLPGVHRISQMIVLLCHREEQARTSLHIRDVPDG